ncbi:MAG: NAD(P)/FAD-dependent oxidoreductase [Acidobacteriota bacterium]
MSDYDAIIIGGGPAGSSAAISLSQRGLRVLVLEEKRMPRGKLCGEFITPECFPTLERLGVMHRMLAAGAQKISRVSLVAASGRSVQTHISKMSDDATWAMSLSRARFDQVLFDRAREAGAVCLEGVAVKGSIFDDGALCGVEALFLSEGARVSFEAPLVIDASGRNSRLMVGKSERVAGRRGSRLYALKAHLKGVEGIGEQVELYFFSRGYGGLTLVEEGLVNLCFIVDERTLKSAGRDPSKVIEQSLMKNSLARERLKGAEVVGKWHSAGPLTFGRRCLARNGVIAIGDASGMIDPFTGTGIQMALRTGEMVAEAIFETMGSSLASKTSSDSAALPQVVTANPGSPSSSLLDSVLACYGGRYEREFDSRMKVAGLLRAAAFSPLTASVVARVLARAPKLTGFVLKATRSGNGSRGNQE